MAEIRYTGLPQRYTVGPGAQLQNKWANFMGAELPMGLIKALPIAGGNRKALIQALMKLLQEEEEKQKQSGMITTPGPGFGAQTSPYDRVSLLDQTLDASPTFDMTKFGE
tara:strand:- start:63 stop:392 length:330 start_codon:yes stop_codon:yes gene_type:complete